MLIWNRKVIDKLMADHGLANANMLHEFTGLTVPTAYNLLRGEPLKRVDVSTLDTLVRAFKVRHPLTLLEYRK